MCTRYFHKMSYHELKETYEMNHKEEDYVTNNTQWINLLKLYDGGLPEDGETYSLGILDESYEKKANAVSLEYFIINI
jgi:hypothetical protein